jgi:TrmH family RNA methyltransferase
MLTSLKNPKVEAASRLKKRTSREADRRFLVEGPQAVGEALACGRLLSLYFSDELSPVVVAAGQAGVELHHVSEPVMAKITSTVTPQGLAGVSEMLDVSIDQIPVGGVVVLHQVSDPGNAGTILRSSDAAGGSGMAFADGSVDPYNPKTVRAAAGSHFHVPFARGTSTSDAIASLRSRGSRILAMDPHGRRDIYEASLEGPVAFVFGNEAHGLPPEVAAAADEIVRVPHRGRAESLNLAAAATVALFEWARRGRSTSTQLETLIAAAAHDLRSPLTAMKGFGYALEKRWDSMTDEQRSVMLRGIVFDADRMDQILRLLVDAARMQGDGIELFPEQTPLERVVGEVASLLGRDPEHPAVSWTGRPSTVLIDPARLRTVLLSFIEAQVWWSREGPILVSGGSSDGVLSLEVARAGTELDDEGAETLFAPRRPGTGSGSKIGMFVSRGLARAMGGDASARVDRGSLILRFEVPLG